MPTIDEMLDLEPVGERVFASKHMWGPAAFTRAFGGLLIGQSLAAAFKTVDSGYVARSLHTLFVGPVSKNATVQYHVSDQALGSNNVTRTVSGYQTNKLVIQTTCHFIREKANADKRNYNHEYQTRMPQVPTPDDKDSGFNTGPPGYSHKFPVNVWVPEVGGATLAHSASAQQYAWLKCPTAQERSTQIHQCILATYSDVHMMRTIVGPFGFELIVSPKCVKRALSIDHHVWFHQHADCSEYVLASTRSLILNQGRGAVHCELFAADGRLVATAVQEARLDIDPLAKLSQPKL